MADLKISQLTDGGASQATDEYVIARSGANYRIDGASVAAAATSVGTLTSLTVSGDLTVDTNTLKVDSTNNRVGIGVTSPSSALTVSAAGSTSNANVESSAIRTTAGGTLSCFIGHDTGLNRPIIQSSTGNAGSAFSLFLQPYGGDLNVDNGTFVVDAANDRVHIGSSSTVNSSKLTVLQGGGNVQMTLASSATKYHSFYVDGNGGLFLQPNGSTAANLDASGNLGLGVTPDTWGARVIQFANGIGIGTRTANGSVLVTQNAILDGSDVWKYKATAGASVYQQVGGQHFWSVAGSGTAGNTITAFNSAAMTLDASGNLCVGRTTTVNNARFISAGSSVAYATEWSNDIYMSQMYFDSAYYMGLVGNAAGREARLVANSGDGTAKITFYTDGAGTPTERARITSVGTLGVGTTTDGFNGDAGLWLRGNLKVAQFSRSGDPSLNLYRLASNGDIAQFHRDSTLVGSISVTTTATAYNTSSDRRLKENIVPAGEAGDIIDAIQIVQYDWKVGGHTRFGVVAQDEVENVPEAINVGDDGDEIAAMWGVDYSKLVPMLVKEIQSLRARVAALEA